MDLDTFLTTLYVLIDDWYKATIAEAMRRHAGPALQMSDSEVMTVALVGQWQVGVPWRSERGVVRYMQRHGRGWFPSMLGRSAFNERVRHLWGAFVQLQQAVAAWLEQPRDLYESVDSVPLPACSLAQAASQDGHWLWWSQRGYGGNNGGWYWGDQVLTSVTRSGVVTGWLIGPAASDDRWLLQALISARAGRLALVQPAGGGKPLPVAPSPGSIGPCITAGHAGPRPYLADQGFNGARWQRFWQQHYQAEVITVPPASAPEAWPQPWKQWLAHHRQIIDTVFARLVTVFGLHHLAAHSRWGQVTRIAAKMAAYNLGIWLNRRLGCPDGALETLIC